MKLLDYFLADMADARDYDDRDTRVRYWRRACMESLHERSLNSAPYPHSRKTKRVTRYIPTWMAISDVDIRDVLEMIKSLD